MHASAFINNLLSYTPPPPPINLKRIYLLLLLTLYFINEGTGQIKIYFPVSTYSVAARNPSLSLADFNEFTFINT